MGKKNFDFDLIILGSGSAGSAAASLAAEARLKTAIVEAGDWGGAGLNGSDVFKEAAFNFSHLYSDAVAGARFGLSSGSLRFNYPTALNWQNFAAKRSGFNNKKVFEDAGISCFHGFANFLSPYEISVGQKRLTAANFIISTGAKIFNGNISGVADVACLTPTSALKLSRLPKTIFVVGGGSTGCELAQHFAELGVKVYLGELSNELLPREDIEAGKILNLYFQERLKIKVLTQSRVISVEKTDAGKKVSFLRGGAEKSVVVDEIVLATGSLPNVDLGLENTGVRFLTDGIEVNRYLQTTVKHIYAAGDVTGTDFSSPERAAYEGALAVANIVNRSRNMSNYTGYARLTKTTPGVASVGLSETECLRRNLKYNKSLVALSSTFAANVYDFRAGFVKLIAEKNTGKILGATIVAPNVDLMIQEISFAVRHGLTVTQLASTPHVASSWSEAVRLAARKLIK